MKILAALLFACVFGSSAPSAHDYALKSLKIDHPFARATPPGAKVAGVFVTVENTGTQPDRLLSVSTPIAGVAELHQMSVDAGVMRMRGVAALEVRPGEKLQLKPGGYHVMLSELRRPLKVGDKFPLTLTFQNAGTIDVSVWVEEMGASAAAHGH
ncbi:MAG TPA: copper chaperone PCu(A)C [Casimicrobiaceae bacterium]|nr:copper chaperone PCu(A)C [Casimicrobiaceae bacterium]